jgi:hypothetical protein
MFENSVHTSKITHLTITKSNWLMLFEEVIVVYDDKYEKSINTKYRVTDYKSRWDIYSPLDFKELKYS